MLPTIPWAAVLELSRMSLTRSEQLRLQHLADLKHAAKEAKQKASREQKADAGTVAAGCCQPVSS